METLYFSFLYFISQSNGEETGQFYGVMEETGNYKISNFFPNQVSPGEDMGQFYGDTEETGYHKMINFSTNQVLHSEEMGQFYGE